MMSNVGRETSKNKSENEEGEKFQKSLFAVHLISVLYEKQLREKISFVIFFSIGSITAKLLFLTGKDDDIQGTQGDLFYPDSVNILL